MPLEVARQVAAMPDARLVELLLGSQLTLVQGRVHLAGPVSGLPDAVRSAVATLRAELAQRPFAAPEAHRLAELGLGAKQLAAAVRAGELLKIASGIYLAPGADDDAVERLRGLPTPFTLSQARQALDTTRRVTVPIMELLARRGISRQLADGTHELL
jgi:selenocysteine-specific elongation factor